MLAGLSQADLSAGTEAFRDELPARCLAALDANVRGSASGPGAGWHAVELGDADLRLLAAAGDSQHFDGPSQFVGGGEASGWPCGPNA